MNPISSLAKDIQARFPQWRFTEDIAEQPSGVSFLDVEFQRRTAVVEWRLGKGFGISSGPVEGYGTGPDEIYPTAENILGRLEDVLERAQRTVPIRERGKPPAPHSGSLPLQTGAPAPSRCTRTDRPPPDRAMDFE